MQVLIIKPSLPRLRPPVRPPARRVVFDVAGNSANMERIMRAQTLSDSRQMGMMAGQRSMEINPRHPIVHELNKRVRRVFWHRGGIIWAVWLRL